MKINKTLKNCIFFALHFLACLMFIVAVIFLFGILKSCKMEMPDTVKHAAGKIIVPTKEIEPEPIPEPEPEPEPIPEPEPEPEVIPCEMAILVYMAADNNLESSAIHDFNEMEAAEIPKNATVLVLFDRAEGYDQTNENWTGTRLYKVSHDNGGNNSIIVSERLSCERLDLSVDKETELDMGKKETLTGFIEFAKQEYKPEKMSLIIWGHGNGWKSDGFETGFSATDNSIFENTKAFAMDNMTGSHLTTSELRQGIENALGKEKLDFLGFDTCFGSTIEVAYEMKNCAKIMGGSAGVVPSDGWDYEKLLTNFFWGTSDSRECDSREKEDDCLTGEKFSEAATKQFIEQYSSHPFTSFITLDLENLEQLYEKFNAWCDVVSKNITSLEIQKQYRTMLADKNQVASYFSASTSSKGYDYYVDIYDMSEKTATFFSTQKGVSKASQTELGAAKDELQDALLKTTILSWSAENDSLFSLGVFFALFSPSGQPFSSHPEEYFYKLKATNQNLFSRNSSSWVPTESKNTSLIDAIFYKEF